MKKKCALLGGCLWIAMQAISAHADIAEDLGWVDAADSDLICRGYYREPLLTFASDLPPDSQATKITADQSSLFREGTSNLHGNIMVEQRGRRLLADNAQLFRPNSQSPLQQIILQGQVHLYEPGILLLSDWVDLELEDNSGKARNVWYRYAHSDAASEYLGIRQLYGVNAQGHAKQVERDADGIWHFHHATYSTCPPNDETWQLQASHVKLDRESGRGSATNSVFRVKDIPVFYFPYLSFPIDDRRETGFLTPTLSESTRNGWGLHVPFYWNMAPNYDATLTAHFYELRGVMGQGDFRYLLEQGAGDFKFTFLPDDDEFTDFKAKKLAEETPSTATRRLDRFSDNRYLLHFYQDYRFNAHWTSKIDYSYVSDDYYFQDFGDGLVNSTENQLLQEARLDYNSRYWQQTLRVQHYQTLHPINQTAIDDPYSRLPQWEVKLRDLQLGDAEFNATAEAVYFDRPKDPNTREEFAKGTRLHLQPTLNYQLTGAAWYLTPELSVPMTAYDLHDQPYDRSQSITRALPIVSIDGGLFFERNWQFSDMPFRQTLEPRVFYLYAPYDEQSDIPNFDSSIPTFTFDRLFVNNRFTGYDRFGDANQFSFALTSRFIDQKSGNEKVRLSIGQMVFLRDRKVMLCDTPGCVDKTDEPGSLPNDETLSPLVANIQYYLTPGVSATADWAWDHRTNETINTALYMHYQPEIGKIMNIGYDYVRNGETSDTENKDLEQITTSMAWPLKRQWGIFGAFAYNIAQKHVQNGLFGVQYEACCYALRGLVSYDFTAFDDEGDTDFDTNFYLQLQFKGLGNLRTSDPGHLLKENIPGYQDRLEGVV